MFKNNTHQRFLTTHKNIEYVVVCLYDGTEVRIF